MFKIIFSTTILLATAGIAAAADMPVKAPVARPPAFSWTGCYVGGHLGGVVSENGAAVPGQSNSATGFVGGGQVGCDYQFASNWVVGAEGRAAWSSLAQHRSLTVFFPAGATVPSLLTFRTDILASATARLGYSFADRWLVYARGGAAWVHEKGDFATAIPSGLAVDPAGTFTRAGWTAGGGLEWAFAPHWSANVEYNYYDFGTYRVTLAGPRILFVEPARKDAINAATIGVNYRF